MREMLFTPLGLTHTVTLPEEAILYAAAVGHVDVGDEQVVTPAWALQRSAGPGRAHHGASRRPARLRPAAHGRRRDRRTARACSPRRTSSTCRRSRPTCPTRTRSATRGGSAGSASTGTASGSTATTATPSVRRRSCASTPDPAPRWPCSPTAATPTTSTRTLYREIFAEIADVEMRHPLEAPAEPAVVDLNAHVGVYERASVRMEILARRERPAAAHRGARPAGGPRARPGRGVPGRARHRRPLPPAPAGNRDVDADHVLLAARPARSTSTSARVPHRSASTHDHRDERTGGASGDARRHPAARRMRVTVVGSRGGRPLAPTSSPGSEPSSSAPIPSGSSSTASRICAGASAATHAGAGARASRHGLADRVARDPSVRGRGRHPARTRLLRHEMRPRDGVPRDRLAAVPRGRDAPGDR